ncbi:hypothetical protein CDAR_596051 [Caerostris darwini]|uniref:Uncharacterized protein n=1 Tax=Caerostris darwini TaxID=1538125 RepID=A0AAV4WYH8_9ARAC|nr:hypothetical protein CDAR_596051 [Caerostris darwini]
MVAKMGALLKRQFRIKGGGEKSGKKNQLWTFDIPYWGIYYPWRDVVKGTKDIDKFFQEEHRLLDQIWVELR